MQKKCLGGQGPWIQQFPPLRLLEQDITSTESRREKQYVFERGRGHEKAIGAGELIPDPEKIH